MRSVDYLLSPIYRVYIFKISIHAKQNVMMHEFRHSEQRTMKRCCLLILMPVREEKYVRDKA